MSDPTTAEQVVRDAIDTWRDCYDADDMHGPSMQETIVAALRNSPDALADLCGGEWVQPENVNHIRPWWDGRTARMRERRGLGVGPLFVFVPREATDG